MNWEHLNPAVTQEDTADHCRAAVYVTNLLHC